LEKQIPAHHSKELGARFGLIRIGDTIGDYSNHRPKGPTDYMKTGEEDQAITKFTLNWAGGGSGRRKDVIERTDLFTLLLHSVVDGQRKCRKTEPMVMSDGLPR